MTHFIFVGCQTGSEAALKQNLAQHHPELTFAFSRPGFVTFRRRDAGDAYWERGDPILLKTPFARCCGYSLGEVRDRSTHQTLSLIPAKPFRHLHVWRRDEHVPGDRRFEPFPSSDSAELGRQLKSSDGAAILSKSAINRTAKHGDYVVDLIVVEPSVWFVGWHRAQSIASRWPGGVPPLRAPINMVSRAYLKMAEALRWSQLPMAAGDTCVELGSAPGGSCQALLERGLRVTGIDPGIMDPRILEHPGFTHIRARAGDLKRKEFAAMRWLVADANVAPRNTLEAVEHIVTNRRVHIQGMLITLKILDWSMVDDLDDYLDRIRGWGYRYVRARQLAFNRREICVMAVRSKSQLRLHRRRKTSNSQTIPTNTFS